MFKRRLRMRITSSGLRESHIHDTRESPTIRQAREGAAICAAAIHPEI
jgi:hypothetical protein